MSPTNMFRGEERDWPAQYAAIGEFVVEFEMICDRIRFSVQLLLQSYGLDNWKLGEIIVNQRCFTAEALNSLLSSVVGEISSERESLALKSKAFRTKFQDLIQIRNDLLHATWLIGPHIVDVTDSESPQEISAVKRDSDKKGSRVRVLANEISDMKRHTESARDTWKLLDALFLEILQVITNRTLQELEHNAH